MDYLKEFQKCTVESVLNSYKKHNRILVADEVGLGKTMIARSVIEKLQEQNSKDTPFRTIYLCSNQNIIDQNIQKLNIRNQIYTERLSMQGLNLYATDNTKYKGQIFPITVGTSILTSGSGRADERAYIYLVLTKIKDLVKYKKELRKILKAKVGTKHKISMNDEDQSIKAFEYRILNFIKEKNIRNILKSKKFKDEFILRVNEKIKEKSENGESLKQKIINQCENKTENRCNEIISGLRQVFLDVTLEKLKPDLIIMDEFQNFKRDIMEGKTRIVVDRLLGSGNKEKTKVLLLSATPYKLYSTTAEIQNNFEDNSHEDFFEVIKFLLEYENDSEKFEEFKNQWKTYSNILNRKELTDELVLAKNNVEDILKGVIYRTERANKIKEREDKNIKVNENDILAYIQFNETLKEVPSLKRNLRIDFVKSCAYPLSYMGNNYELKRKLEREFSKCNELKIDYLNKDLLWINKEKIDNYEELDNVNSKLDKLKKEVFKDNLDQLLWMPPTEPYYQFNNVYKETENATKTLVFSTWAMIPKMISTLISYEDERRRIGLVYGNTERKYTKYSDSQNRQFSPELNFRADKNKSGEYISMPLLSIRYPSVWLANVYNPSKYLKKDLLNSAVIEDEIKKIIKNRIDECKFTIDENSKEDRRWLYIAPLLLDDEWYVNNWLESNIAEKDNSLFKDHIVELKKEYDSIKSGNLKLGKKPKNLEEWLAKLSIASPAICALRSFSNIVEQFTLNDLKNEENIAKCVSEYASKVSKLVFNLFNSSEAISILKANYKNLKNYMQKVLQYCVDGNFQAMIDEYVYLLSENTDISINTDIENIKAKFEKIFGLINEAMGIRTAVENVDTFESFKSRIMNNKENSDDTKLENFNMRSHFALGFYKNVSDENVVNRKNSIRMAFNSPFRPFVLATTSIGQEGLDFHYYCNKIVHWNLPNNPIDIEQREGRVNRYKCLAIRKYWVNWIKNKNIEFETNNIWKEIFTKLPNSNNEKVPYWEIPSGEKLDIERIVFLYEYSTDIQKYVKIKDTLRLYKIVLGQKNQEELLEEIQKNIEGKECDIEKFIIDFTPNM